MASCLLLLLSYFLIILICEGKQNRLQAMTQNIHPDYKEIADKPNEKIYHTVVFAIKQRNIDILEKTLYDVSDPFSFKYGEYLSSDEVASLTSNPLGFEAVKNYLQSNKAAIVSSTLHGEYITASSSINNWETVFNTKFYSFINKRNGDILYRAKEINIMEEIHQHLY